MIGENTAEVNLYCLQNVSGGMFDV